MHNGKGPLSTRAGTPNLGAFRAFLRKRGADRAGGGAGNLCPFVRVFIMFGLRELNNPRKRFARFQEERTMYSHYGNSGEV